MEFIITFFRDILDGPIYIVVAIICVILICSCIGYLAETSLNKKKAKQEYDETHADLSANQEITTPVSDAIEQSIPSDISNEANNVQPGVVMNTVSSVENNNQSYNPTMVQNQVPTMSQPSISNMSQPSVPNLNAQPYNPQVNPSIPPTMGPPVEQPTVVNTNQNINP